MKRLITSVLAVAAAAVLGAQSPASALEQEIISASAVYSIDYDTMITGGTAELIHYSTRSDFNARVCHTDWPAPGWGDRATFLLEDTTTGTVVGTFEDTTNDGVCVYKWIPGKVVGHTYKLTVKAKYGDGWTIFTPTW